MEQRVGVVGWLYVWWMLGNVVDGIAGCCRGEEMVFMLW